MSENEILFIKILLSAHAISFILCYFIMRAHIKYVEKRELVALDRIMIFFFSVLPLVNIITVFVASTELHEKGINPFGPLKSFIVRYLT